VAGVEVIGLLCAGSVKYHAVSGGSSGDCLSRSELSGLLSGLGEQAMNMALAKYAGDEQSERKLIAHVRVYAAGIAVNERWEIVKGRPIVANMAAVAVFEVVRPNRCGACGGTSFVGRQVCKRCSGLGYRSCSSATIAEAMGIDKSNYSRLWKARYNNIYQYVNDLDVAVKRVLRHADGGNDLMVA